MECYLLIILSSLFSKHVNLHTKNNTIVHIVTLIRLPLGFGIMFLVNISKNWSNLIGVLMHITNLDMQYRKRVAIIMILNCKIPIRTYTIYYMGFRYI